MTCRGHDALGRTGLLGRSPGNWKLALGELVIIALGVLIALWADQWMQSREDAAREFGYLERLQEDVRADLRSLRFSADQARNRLAITRQVDAWLNDPAADPDPDTLVMKVHFAGVLFPPTISTFTIDELKSTGDLPMMQIVCSCACARARTSRAIYETACTGLTCRRNYWTVS